MSLYKIIYIRCQCVMKGNYVYSYHFTIEMNSIWFFSHAKSIYFLLVICHLLTNLSLLNWCYLIDEVDILSTYCDWNEIIFNTQRRQLVQCDNNRTTEINCLSCRWISIRYWFYWQFKMYYTVHTNMFFIFIFFETHAKMF